MSQLALYLLGSPRPELDGVPIHIQRRKALALLVYLAVERNRSHSRESLFTLLWPGMPEKSARQVLRQTLYALRQDFPDLEDPQGNLISFLLVDRQSVQLNPARELTVDIHQLDDSLTSTQTHDHPDLANCSTCIAALESALALYQADFLADFYLEDSNPYEEWAEAVRETYRHKLVELLITLKDIHKQKGDYQGALAYIDRQIAMDDLSERAHRQKIELLALSGRRVEAMRQYRSFAGYLQEQLKTAPSQETTTLYEWIRSEELAAGLPRPESTAPKITESRHNLPIQTTPFVGREKELAELGELLTDPNVRLVTILGPGGSGKTRLAQEAAATQLENFERGVFFAHLASVESEEHIVPTIAEALGFSFYAGGEPRKQLLDYLRAKNILLVMDNYEHLLSGVEIASQILETAPGVKILATSRERLNLSGEHRYRLEGLSLPGGQSPEAVLAYSAVELFLESARRAKPDFELDQENLESVVRICRLVEGMPLGIRLAAVWVEILSPAEIAQEIERGLDFLDAGWRDMPERQRSIQAVYDHSWQLLSMEEREVFQGLSIFRGGFTRAAAEEVAGASMHILMKLVDKSLISRKTSGCYEIHELGRQYAAGKLALNPDRAVDTRDRHCTWFMRALELWDVDRKGPRQTQVVAELIQEIDNIRVAWDWAVDQRQIERLNQAIHGLGSLYLWHCLYAELESSCRRAREVLESLPATSLGPGTENDSIQHPDDRNWLLARILVYQWAALDSLGYETDLQQLERSLAILDQLEKVKIPGGNLLREIQADKAAVLILLGGQLHYTSNLEQGMQYLKHGIALYREIGDQWGLANALHAGGWAANLESILDESDRMWRESLTIRQALGDQIGIAASLHSLAVHFLVRGQYEESNLFFAESLAIRKELGVLVSFADGLVGLGLVYLRQGDFIQALSLLEESTVIFQDLGVHSFMSVFCELSQIEAKAHLGQYRQSCSNVRRLLMRCQEMIYGEGTGLSHFVSALIGLGEGKYAEANQLIEKSIAMYRAIRHRELLGFALALSGYAARGLGKASLASIGICDALQIALDLRVIEPIEYGLPIAALLFADQGKIERAVELYALASRYGYVANSCWFEDLAGRELNAVAGTLPTAVVTAAQARGRELDLWETAKELLVQLEEMGWGNAGQ